jgi:hypothetical protein
VKGLKKPELKLSGAKPPQTLADLFYDLRDRRLLPLVALVVVAIAAAPFLLGSDEEEVVPPPGGGVAETLEELGDGSAELTVVEAKPGLRDYRKRLDGRSPSNPFEQRYAGAAGLDKAELGGGQGGGGKTTETSTTVTEGGGEVTVTEETTTEPGRGGGSGGAAPPSKNDGGIRWFTVTIDVKISRTRKQPDGTVKWGEPTTRRGVKPLVSLPGEKAPVITYTGFNAGTSKLLFSVSHGVSATYGDGACIAGTDACNLLEIEPGFPQEFVYGPNDVRYRMLIVDVDVVRAKAPGK